MKRPRHTTLSYLLYSMSPLTHLKQKVKQFLKQLADYRYGIPNVFHIREKKGVDYYQKTKKIFLDFFTGDVKITNLHLNKCESYY